MSPTSPLDFICHPTTKQFSGDAEEKAKQIKKLHESVKVTIERQNKK